MRTSKKVTINNKVNAIIASYARIYKKFEALQGDNKKSVFTIGDQKTGVIGEYYAKKYIEMFLTDGKTIAYAKHGADYDIEYKDVKGNLKKVQVKVVSSFSKTRIISPLKLRDKKGEPMFDFLYLIALDSKFRPANFWINSFKEIEIKAKEKNKIQGSTMRDTSEASKIQGSNIYNFDKDIVKDMINSVDVI